MIIKADRVTYRAHKDEVSPFRYWKLGSQVIHKVFLYFSDESNLDEMESTSRLWKRLRNSALPRPQ